MANANRRFGHFTFAIFASSAAIALAAAVLAYRPDLGAGNIALSIGTATPISEASFNRHGDQMAVDQMAVFLQRWTNTTAGDQ